MKAIQLVILLFLIGLISCNSTGEESAANVSVDSIESVSMDTQKMLRTGERYNRTAQQIEEEREVEIADSIHVVETLKLALKISNLHKNQKEFTLQTDTLNIRYGYLFSSSVKHLIINRNFQYGFITDIYKLHNNNFEHACSKEMAPMAYVGDTIQDVNGDGRLDYLFHWYPMSGCCLRDIYDVYLQKNNGFFADEVEFINPTFSANEKIIRGLCYGHAAPLYKYKWNGYDVDTIEFIYSPDSLNGNNFIRRKHKDVNEPGEIIKQLPDEYNKLDLY